MVRRVECWFFLNVHGDKKEVVCSYIAEAKGICFMACAASGAISKLLFVSNGTLPVKD